jgi:hypothetical protein
MKNIYEVFDDIEKSSSRSEKIETLRKNDSFALRQVLRGTYDPNIKFAITKVPYYKPSDSPPGLAYTGIHQELDRVYLFQEDNPRVSPDLTEKRREQILIQILESLEKREAEIYMNMLLKKQVVKGLNLEVVKEAFPDLI